MLGPTDLNLRHLDALLTVHRLGGITAAAAAVNMSQSALTGAILNLERQLGQKLFTRTPSGVITTAPGCSFIARVDRAITRIVQGHQLARASAKLRSVPFPQRHITMKQIRAFLAVEQTSSYSAAARALELRQPSVHRAVRELESILCTRFFVRRGRSIRPTHAAERFARSLRLALLELRSGLEEIAPESMGITRLAIGALSLPLAWLVPKVLDEFVRAHSGIQINVVQGTHAELLLQLESGDIDMLVDTYRPFIAPETVHQELLFANRFHIAASANHPLAGTRPTSSQLALYPWLVGPSEAPIRHAWAEIFSGGDFPSAYIECTSTSAIRSFLLQGNWLALLSLDQFQLERSIGALTCIDVSPFEVQREVSLTTRTDWKPTPMQEELVGCFRRAAARMRAAASV